MSPCLGRLKSFLATSTPSGDRVSAYPIAKDATKYNCAIAMARVRGGFTNLGRGTWEEKVSYFILVEGSREAKDRVV